VRIMSWGRLSGVIILWMVVGSGVSLRSLCNKMVAWLTVGWGGRIRCGHSVNMILPLYIFINLFCFCLVKPGGLCMVHFVCTRGGSCV